MPLSFPERLWTEGSPALPEKSPVSHLVAGSSCLWTCRSEEHFASWCHWPRGLSLYIYSTPLPRLPYFVARQLLLPPSPLLHHSKSELLLIFAGHRDGWTLKIGLNFDRQDRIHSHRVYEGTALKTGCSGAAVPSKLSLHEK